MSRPSRNQDQLLIEAAKRLLPKLGTSGMSLKMVAEEAGVNVGMFNYYFKTKSNFIRKILESFREEARREAEISVPQDASSLEKLRHYLNRIGRGYRDHRHLVLAMYRDLLNHDPDVSAFLLENMHRQFFSLRRLIKQCQIDGHIDPSLPFPQIITFCLAAIKAPIVVSEILKTTSAAKFKLPNNAALLTTDHAIAQRVEMVLRGIAPHDAPRHK